MTYQGPFSPNHLCNTTLANNQRNFKTISNPRIISTHPKANHAESMMSLHPPALAERPSLVLVQCLSLGDAYSITHDDKKIALEDG
jgi:hypothetical protein